MAVSRRGFVGSLCRTASVFAFDQLIAGTRVGAEFVNIARESGLRSKTIFGGERRNRFLLETTGCGVAFFDFDHDGWLDIFLVNGTRFEAKWARPDAPVSRLYRNNRDGTFTDVTADSGLARTGWGQGCCTGDYDNDGLDDLVVTYWGDCVLYRNLGNGKFRDVSQPSGIALTGRRTPTGLNRWNTGCAFVDYDRDGNVDLFVANYIDFDPKTVAVPESGKCLYKGMRVACGPPGLDGGKNLLFRNNGDGTFTDVSGKSGILKTAGTYGLGVLVSDFDNDGWPDIYVANDSTSPSNPASPTARTASRRREWA
jgi:enediyne biosynthesis protein E4